MKKILFTLTLVILTACASAKEVPLSTIEIVKEVKVVEKLTLVERAEKSLNSFKTIKGFFKQYNNDSSIFTGEFWIQKPGKMRFDYAYPNKNFIVSNGTFIFYWDEYLQQQTNAPLSFTPAGIILNEKMEFGKDIKVKNAQENDDSFSIDLYYNENEDMGFVTLTFDKLNDKLTQWKIKELNGNTTIIIISDVEFDIVIDEDKFDFKDPRYNPFKLN